MLKSVRLKNVKLFREVNIPLERLTIFVGPNSSGKTSVLEAIKFLALFSSKEYVFPLNIEEYWPQSPSQMKRRGSAESFQISCDVSTKHETFSMNCLPTEIEGSDGIKSWEIKVEKNGHSVATARIREERRDGIDPSTVVGSFDVNGGLAHIGQRCQLLRLDAGEIAQPGETNSLSIAENGRGIAGMIQDMLLNQPDKFSELQNAVRAVVPSLDRIRMARTTIRTLEHQVFEHGPETISRQIPRKIEAYRLILDMKSAPDIPDDSASEGTLLVIGLLTVLMSSSRPLLLLLDDIDHGLHPKATGDLIGVIRTLLEKDPELQIIATSHSPYLLDHLKYEEVRLTTLNPDGTAKVGLLSDHPDFDRWKDVMSPGEFWSTVGEKWLADKQEKPSHA